MYYSWHEAVMAHKDLPEEEFFETISSFSMELFQPLLDHYAGNYAKLIVLYIVSGYSQDSPEVLLPNNWSTQKKKLFEKYNLPDSVEEDVLRLKSEVVKRVIIEFLDVQEDFDYKQLRMNEDLYEYHMNKVYGNINTGQDDDINDRHKKMEELQKLISGMKKEMHEKYDKNRDNRRDVGPIKTPKTRRTLNVATSPEVTK